jgi:hypothetical protein
MNTTKESAAGRRQSWNLHHSRRKRSSTASLLESREYTDTNHFSKQTAWTAEQLHRKGFRRHSYDVPTPPCIFRRFTPNGRFLLALDRNGTDLLVFPYVHWSSSVPFSTQLKGADCCSAEDPANKVNLSESGGSASFSDFFREPLRISVVNAYTTGFLAYNRARGFGMDTPLEAEWDPTGVYLRDLLLCTPCGRFVLLGAWRAPSTPALTHRGESLRTGSQITAAVSENSHSNRERSSTDSHMESATTGSGQRGSFRRLAARHVADSSSPASLAGCPVVPSVYLFLVDMELQRVVDVFMLRNDLVLLDGNSGVQLFDADLVAVTSMAHQAVHLLRIRQGIGGLNQQCGCFQYLTSFGPHCFSDDALLIAKQYRRERDFRRQGRRVFALQLRDLLQTENSSAESEPLDDVPVQPSEANNDASAAGACILPSHPQETSVLPVGMQKEPVGGIVESGIPQRRCRRQRPQSDDNSEREASPFVMPCTSAAAVAGTAMAAAACRMAYRPQEKECFITGLKQRLLTFLYRSYTQGKPCSYYERFAASFESLQSFVIQRAALISKKHVLVRMVPARLALKHFLGRTACSLFHQPWYVSGVAVTGLVDSDLALLHAAEAHSTADSEQIPASAEPGSYRQQLQHLLHAPCPVLADNIVASKRRQDALSALVAQLRTTFYVIYDYLSTQIEAVFSPGSVEFLALARHHPEWFGLRSGVPLYRIESAVERLEELKLVCGAVYCPVCHREHRCGSVAARNTPRNMAHGTDERAALVKAEIALLSAGAPLDTSQRHERWSMAVKPEAGAGETSSTGKRADTRAVTGNCTTLGQDLTERGPVMDVAHLYREPLLTMFLLLPLPCQPAIFSPWLNRRFFSYDESKLWSRDLFHPAVCDEYPMVRVFHRVRGTLSWRIYPAAKNERERLSARPFVQQQQQQQRLEASRTHTPVEGARTSTTHAGAPDHSQRTVTDTMLQATVSYLPDAEAEPRSRVRQYASYIFHPQDAFCLSILWSSERAPVVNLHYA